MEEWLKEAQLIFNRLCELENTITNTKFDSILQNQIKKVAEQLLSESFIALGMLSTYLAEVNNYNKGKQSYLQDWLKINK